MRCGTTIFPGVEVHVLSSEAHRHAAQATRYGVESGKSVSDHIILNPVELSVRFEMTNAVNGAQEARDVFQQIVKTLRARELFTVETEHARYNDMAVTGFMPEHRSPYKGALVVDLRLTQVGIIGQGSNVAVAGGRNAFVLAGDGTQKTGCGRQYDGMAQPNTDRAQLGACMAKAAS